MKKLKCLLIAVSALLLSSCDDEDGFYNEKYVAIPNLVSIDNAQPTYSVGDKLYVASDFSRLQAEPGFSSQLDLYETTSGAPGFMFSYMLEKESSAGVWTVVSATGDQLDIVSGSAQASSYVLATALYNPADQTYEYYGGFPLTSAGNYRLSFGVNSDATNVIELRSRTQGNNLFLNIDSSTTQLNGSGFYTFTVN